MRLSEIVNTLTAYQMLQSGLTGRNVGAGAKSASADTGSRLTADTGVQSEGLEWLDQSGDTVDLSGTQRLSDDEGPDDSLGAIVESFIRQRQTYAFTLPGIKGISSPISVTWEVEEAYRIIQFVPAGQSLDTQA